MKNLVIVESPAKCKTIEKYLGSDYKVVSSKGHIRDLATTGKFGLGIDVEHDFEPNYQIIKGKNKEVTALKKDVKDANIIYLATDPDREGETISWHIYDEIKIPDEKYKRVVFNEITKDVVINAINNPGKIDMNLVRSGETRRFLDRIIGFRLSKLMQRKTGGKSAGRVQSVALKLIVDREREIQAFVPREYWTIEADFKDFKATLDKYHGKEVEIPNEVEADEILSKLSKSFKIESVTEKEKNKSAREVFKTSTLQQAASNKLGFAPSKTMKLAQDLYEGKTLSNETVGLITYMRTDSIRVSDSFVKETFGYIKGKFGETYLLPTYGKEIYRKVLVLGLGKKSEFNPNKMREAIAKAVKKAMQMEAKKLAFSLDGIEFDYSEQFTMGAFIGDYAFDKYKSEKKENELVIPTFLQPRMKK